MRIRLRMVAQLTGDSEKRYYEQLSLLSEAEQQEAEEKRIKLRIDGTEVAFNFGRIYEVQIPDVSEEEFDKPREWAEFLETVAKSLPISRYADVKTALDLGSVQIEDDNPEKFDVIVVSVSETKVSQQVVSDEDKDHCETEVMGKVEEIRRKHKEFGYFFQRAKDKLLDLVDTVRDRTVSISAQGAGWLGERLEKMGVAEKLSAKLGNYKKTYEHKRKMQERATDLMSQRANEVWSKPVPEGMAVKATSRRIRKTTKRRTERGGHFRFPRIPDNIEAIAEELGRKSGEAVAETMIAGVKAIFNRMEEAGREDIQHIAQTILTPISGYGQTLENRIATEKLSALEKVAQEGIDDVAEMVIKARIAKAERELAERKKELTEYQAKAKRLETLQAREKELREELRAIEKEKQTIKDFILMDSALVKNEIDERNERKSSKNQDQEHGPKKGKGKNRNWGGDRQ